MFVCSVPKISQVMMKRRRRAHISSDLLCDTTAAELHNSVDLLCGTTAAETFEKLSKNRSIVDLQQTFEICTLYEMNALRRQNKRPRQTLEDARIST